MECDKNCSTCQSTCGKVCPVCGATAIGVNTATVLNLTDVEVDINDHFYLCLNGKCNAAYFSDLGTLIEKTEVKVPIWFNLIKIAFATPFSIPSLKIFGFVTKTSSPTI